MPELREQQPSPPGTLYYLEDKLSSQMFPLHRLLSPEQQPGEGYLTEMCSVMKALHHRKKTQVSNG